MKPKTRILTIAIMFAFVVTLFSSTVSAAPTCFCYATLPGEYSDLDENLDGICDLCGNNYYSSSSKPEPDEGTTTPTVTYETYFGVTLPTINTVWSNPQDNEAAIIFKDKTADNYHLILGSSFVKDYVYTDTSLSGSPETYCRIAMWTWYDLNGTEWVYNTSATNDVICRTETYDLIWSSKPIYTDSTRTESFFPIAPTPTLAGVVTEQTLEGVTVEILKLIPIVMGCWVGYLALRKGLIICRHFLEIS